MYTYIFNFFSDEYLILRANEDIKNSILGVFFGDIKNYLIAFCPHIDCVFMQNLESVPLMVSEKCCLDMTDRRADGRTWLNRFFSSR